MQTLVATAIVVIVVIVALCLAFGGLAGYWRTGEEFRSPDSKAKISVKHPPVVKDWGVRVVLEDNAGATLLDERRGDVLPSFEHAYWSPDSRVVGFFRCANPRIEIAYDRQAKNKLSFPSIAALVSRSIENEYGVKRHSVFGEEHAPSIALRSPAVRQEGTTQRNAQWDRRRLEPVREDLDWACSDLNSAFLAKHPW